jgi:4-aminobutyrate aminotransferase
LFAELAKIQKKYPFIGDLRGDGLMIGMEIVNPANKEPDTKVIGNLMERTKELGLLMGKVNFRGF